MIITLYYQYDFDDMLPYQAMLSAGLYMVMTAPDWGKGDTVPTAVHDFVGDQTYEETGG